MSCRIGYLVPSETFSVAHCPARATNIRTPVDREHVRGYKQTCKRRGRLLAGRPDAPERFTVSRSRLGADPTITQPSHDRHAAPGGGVTASSRPARAATS